MKAKYDDITVTVTSAFVAALRDLMRAEVEMMRRSDRRNKECWTWGKCTVGDLASARGLEFEFGGDEDMPSDVTPRRRFVVVAVNTRKTNQQPAQDAKDARVPCHCYDDTSRKLCMDKQHCWRAEAQSVMAKESGR